jgi:hypothetical protein
LKIGVAFAALMRRVESFQFIAAPSDVLTGAKPVGAKLLATAFLLLREKSQTATARGSY